MFKISAGCVVVFIIGIVYGIFGYVTDMAAFHLKAVHSRGNTKNKTRIQMKPPVVNTLTATKAGDGGNMNSQIPKEEVSMAPLNTTDLSDASNNNNDTELQSADLNSTAVANVSTIPPEEPKLTPIEIDLSTISGRNAALQTRNYFDLLQQGDQFGNWTNALPPVRLLVSYIQNYSQHALEEAWIACGNQTCGALDNLQFVVGRYSCPLEAGNHMFKFMNHLIWAIVTKRVFLWGYWDKDACLVEHFAGEIDELWCHTLVNSIADCKDILHLASWVPSWDEWSLKLNLTEPVRACAVGRRSKDAIASPMDGGQVPRVIRVGQQLNLELGLIMNQNRDVKVLIEEESINRTEALFRTRGYWGMFFTYGMLFESLFTLDVSLMPELNVLEIDSNKVNSYVLHSRHQNDDDDPLDTKFDRGCMKKVVTEGNATKQCIIYTMTDRQITKEVLPELYAHFNCSAVFTNTTAGTSTRLEHGPFAGRGYFQDLALVWNARQGFMAPHPRERPRVGPRTSSALPRSIIEFRRVLESTSDEAVPQFYSVFSH